MRLNLLQTELPRNNPTVDHFAVQHCATLIGITSRRTQNHKMIDQHFEEAAKRSASKIWEEFGRLALGESDLDTGVSLISNWWPEFLNRVVRHASTLHPTHGAREDMILDIEQRERPVEGMSLQIDAFMNDALFGMDAARSPANPFRSPSARIRSSSPYTNVFSNSGVDSRAQGRGSGSPSEPASRSPTPGTLTTRMTASDAAASWMTAGSRVHQDREQPQTTIGIENSSLPPQCQLNNLAASSTDRVLTPANGECIDRLLVSSMVSFSNLASEHRTIDTDRMGKRRTTKKSLQQREARHKYGGQVAMTKCDRGTTTRRICNENSQRSLQIQDFVDDFGSVASLMSLRSTLLGPQLAQTSPVEAQSDRTAATIFQMMECRDEATQFNVLQQGLDAEALYGRLRLDVCGQPSEYFQLQTRENFQLSARPREGNPIYSDRADLIDRLVRDAAPELEKGSREYKTKRAKAKEFRKCGERLSSMAEKFGRGVIPLALTWGRGEQRITYWRRHMSVHPHFSNEYQTDCHQYLHYDAIRISCHVGSNGRRVRRLSSRFE